MKVVIDTSPLISFAVLDLLGVLEKLFPSTFVPQAVYREIEAGGNKGDKREYIEYIEILKFVKDRVSHPVEKKLLHPKLGKGETEAITLSLRLKADILLLDDKKARTTAESHGIKCIGTLGMLTLAKKKGFIKELRKYFIQLIQNERYFSLPLLNRILELNGEESI